MAVCAVRCPLRQSEELEGLGAKLKENIRNEENPLESLGGKVQEKPETAEKPDALCLSSVVEVTPKLLDFGTKWTTPRMHAYRIRIVNRVTILYIDSDDVVTHVWIGNERINEMKIGGAHTVVSDVFLLRRTPDSTSMKLQEGIQFTVMAEKITDLTLRRDIIGRVDSSDNVDNR